MVCFTGFYECLSPFSGFLQSADPVNVFTLRVEANQNGLFLFGKAFSACFLFLSHTQIYKSFYDHKINRKYFHLPIARIEKHITFTLTITKQTLYMKAFIVKQVGREFYFMEFLAFIGSPSFGPRKDAKEFTTKEEAKKVADQVTDRTEAYEVLEITPIMPLNK